MHIKRTIVITSLASMICTSALANGADLPNVNEYIYKTPTPIQRAGHHIESVLKNYYLTLAYQRGKLDISDIENKSPASGPGTLFPVSESTSKTTEHGLQIAVGRAFSAVRFEFRYTYHSKGGYNPQPVFDSSVTPPSVAINLDSTVENHLFMVNGIYSFRNTKTFQPYLGVGLGVALTNVKGTSSNASTGADVRKTSDSTSGFVWGIQAGFRLKISSYLFANVGYEYDQMSNGAEWDNLSGGAQLVGDKASLNSINFGLTLQVPDPNC